MSRAATDWAWSLTIKPATAKLILLAMADRADEEHQCFPSMKRLVEDTSLDKKTVTTGIARLEADGFLIDTGARKGRTQQVRVLQLNLHMETIGKGTQKRNPSENGSLPSDNQPENGSVNPPKEPENGSSKQPVFGSPKQPENGSLNPPGESPKGIKKGESSASALDRSVLPTDLDTDLMDQWINHRRAIKAPVKSQEILNRLSNDLERARAAGWPPNEALGEAMYAGWRGVKAEWLANRSRSATNGSHQKPRESAADRVRRANGIPVPDRSGDGGAGVVIDAQDWGRSGHG